MRLETRLIKEQKGNPNNALASPIHVSSTFEIADTYHFELSGSDKNEYTYGRFGTPGLSKLEHTLSALEDDCTSLTYNCGISAMAAILDCIFPKRILISTCGFAGTHNVINSYMKGRNVTKYSIEHDLHTAIEEFEENDIVWLETPSNPKGVIADIKAFRKMFPPFVYLVVDSSMAPPPIQYALNLGADIAIHSSTKYLGGHTDILGGVVLMKDKDLHKKVSSYLKV